MRVFFFGGLAAIALFSTASAQTPSVDDADFVKMASVGNTLEVQESKLALTKATDPRLKHFAEKMISDHTEAQKMLETAAGKAGDKASMMLDKPHQAMVDNLETLSGTDFDKVYIADQVASHDEASNLLSDYKQNGKTAALKSWAEKTLPVVKQHREMIDAM